MLAIRLQPETERRLNALAKQTGRTKTYYAREAILRYLDDMEDQYIALDRLEHSGKRWTLEELEQRRDLGSWIWRSGQEGIKKTQSFSTTRNPGLSEKADCNQVKPKKIWKAIKGRQTRSLEISNWSVQNYMPNSNWKTCGSGFASWTSQECV